ncbi:hypothetical protein HB852_09985 [Listeria grandensis]|uniref:hypothetical protein n=1 Tax=Listeria grandensis TaxID=1494963 RepID=UPI0016247103|nr:hypothetical protein [Listeria grandensis]MBC1474947.1 hypothetical protein [Listeria grandensis]
MARKKIKSIQNIRPVWKTNRIVESAYQFSIGQGFKVTRKEVYEKLLEANMIKVNGDPTEYAIEHGLVSDIRTTGLEYFKFFDEVMKACKQLGENPEIEDLYSILVSSGDMDKEGRETLEHFRKNHPEYDGSPDSSFRYSDELEEWMITMGATKKLAQAVLNGDINGNKEKAFELLENIKDK